MNNGLIVGQASYNGRAATDVRVCLDYIEGTSEMNVGRGVNGAPGGIQLYTVNEAPAGGTQLCAPTNNAGAFAISFKWDFLGSGGLPNDIRPFYRIRAVRFTGGRVPQMAGVTNGRRRGLIMNSPRTVADLLGVNIPVEPEGAAGMAVDLASIMRNVGANTLPSPLIGRTVMEIQMFFGIWVFDAR